MADIALKQKIDSRGEESKGKSLSSEVLSKAHISVSGDLSEELYAKGNSAWTI